MHKSDTLQVQIKVSNTGHFDGEEVVQLYLRDLVAHVSRPVKELKDFKKVFIPAGESKTITFQIHVEKLKYWNHEMNFAADAGAFEVMIGTSSDNLQHEKFYFSN